MNLEKAIEILDEYNPEEEYDNYHDIWQALTLGIEALKRFKLYRKDIMPPGGELLPGETEE